MTYAVIATAEIPEPKPHELPKRGYYATVVADILMLPPGQNIRLTFEKREDGDYYSLQVRQAARKAGVDLLCEVREDGLCRYFRLAEKKSSPSWTKAAMRTQESESAKG